MTDHPLAIIYAGPPAADPLDLLMIEQEDWQPYTGVVTRAELVRYLASALYGERYQSRVDCGMAAGAVVCAINVYPRVAGLAYQFHASHGTLSPRTVDMVEEEESINFTLTTEATPTHPPRSISSAEWLAECYDADGVRVDPPPLTIDGGRLTIPAPVHGAVSVRYTTERHGYILSCQRRAAALDNHYSAAVYGVYAGGINWLEIEMPPGIDTFELDPDAVCGWGSGRGTVTWPDGDPYPVADDPHSRHTEVDYCTQEIIKDEVS